MTIQDYNFDNLYKALQQYGDKFVSIYRQKLTQYGVDATGQLGNTLNYIITNNEGVYELSLDIQDYWKYVEEGRRPGRFPPINEIKKWIRIKPVLPTIYKGKLPSADQLTYLIGRKIANKGTRGKYIYKATIDDLGVFEAFNEAIEKDLQSKIDDVFIDFKK